MSTTERQWHRYLSDDDPLSRSVAVELRSVTDIAWDRAPHWGKKKKKLAREANREVIWGGKGPFPCLFPPLGRLVPRAITDIKHAEITIPYVRYGFRVSAILCSVQAPSARTFLKPLILIPGFVWTGA